MIAFEETTTVQPDGRVVVQHPELKPGESVKVIVLLNTDQPTSKKPRLSGRKLKLDWGGGLAEFKDKYTSVELQHKSLEWWGD